VLQRVSIQPRAQCFSGEVNETEKVGFRKEAIGRSGIGLLRFHLNICADLPNSEQPDFA